MILPRILRAALMFACLPMFLMCLCGCGGGGGGADIESVVNDGEDPRIVSVDPAVDAVGIDPTTAIRLRFAVPIDTTSVQPGTLTAATDNAPIDGTITFEDNDRTVVFTPQLPLRFAARTQVTLAAGVRDLQANERQNPFVFAFDTRSAVALPPSPLETDPEITGAVAFRLARDGSGVALYVRLVPGGRDIVAQRFEEGLPTGMPELLQSAPATLNVAPNSLAVAANGHATAVWRVVTPAGPDAYAAFFDPTTLTWDVQPLEDALTRGAGRPIPAVTSTGASVITWLEEPVIGGDALVRRAVRSSPTGPLLVDDLSSGLPALGLSLAMNENGSGVIAWVDEVGVFDFTVMAAGISNATSLAPVPLENRPGDVPSVTSSTVDANGEAVVAWQEVDALGQTESVLAVFGTPTTPQWSGARVLGEALSISRLRATGAAQSGVVLWTEQDVQGSHSAFGSRLDPATGFGPAEPLGAGLGDRGLGTVAANARGDLLIVLFSAGPSFLHTVAWSAADLPSEPTPLTAGPQLTPSVTIDAGGGGFVAYTVHNDPLDPSQGSHVAMRRLASDATSGPDEPLSAAIPGINVSGLAIEVDALGRGAVLFNQANIAQAQQDVLVVALR